MENLKEEFKKIETEYIRIHGLMMKQQRDEEASKRKEIREKYSNAYKKAVTLKDELVKREKEVALKRKSHILSVTSDVTQKISEYTTQINKLTTARDICKKSLEHTIKEETEKFNKENKIDGLAAAKRRCTELKNKMARW